MAKREFLQLAHPWDENRGIAGWFLSEKLDGQRCFWDGGLTRGIPKAEVPYANHDKDSRYVTPPVATGLWSRYGNVIHAPDWWLNKLPRIPLDGELYIGRESRQQLMSTIKRLTPIDLEWSSVMYRVFDMIPLQTVFASGKIDNANFKKWMVYSEIASWLMTIHKCVLPLTYIPKSDTPFVTTYDLLQTYCPDLVHPQIRLSLNEDVARATMSDMLMEISSKGGEGVMVRAPYVRYECCRSHNILKGKKLSDAEGTIVGYTCGRATDKGSRLLGKIGALILDYRGMRLELSGLTDEQRELEPCHINHDATDVANWTENHPEEDVPDWIEAKHFKRGMIVTFKYRGLSNTGVPQEARYWRPYDAS